ncbi:MFS transporter [Amycolatopsis sp. NPDC006125]|uniref:MFS transporter n=1 Tax=Amycolatopsis sp. NPDC006125 TaxID=3156730 RepID=UPI0033BF05FA
MTGTYWRLWWASAVDALGDGAFTAAIPLLATTLTPDPRLIAVLSAVTYLPWLLLSLPAGALVDRCDRATLMWRTQTVQALLTGTAAVLAALHALTLPALATIAFGLGACEVLFGNATQAILPDLVAKPLLPKANGYQQAITTTGQQFAGPPLGSLLFAVSAALPLTLDAVTFAVSAALLATLPRQRPAAHTGSMVTGGLRWLLRHKLLRTLAALLAVNTFCAQLGNATLVLLATQTLHLSTGGYGLLLTGAAVGSLLAGVLDIPAGLGARRTLRLALVANSVIFVAIGLSPTALVLALLLAANGFVTTLWNIVTVSLRQQLVPAGILGRVNSVYRMLGWGLMPFGALTGGLVAHLFGLRAPYPIAGLLRGLGLLAFWSGL